MRMKVRFSQFSLYTAFFPLCCLIPAAQAQPVADTIKAEDFEAGLYEHANPSYRLPYRFMRPVNYDEQKKYPLAIFLHGGGECGNDNKLQIDGQPAWAMTFADSVNRLKYPAFLLAPQCPKNDKWGWNNPIVIGLIGYFKKTYGIDSNRITLTGPSLGGWGSWMLVQEYPKYFAAAAPICGVGKPEDVGMLVKFPLWVFHGGADNVVSPENSRVMVRNIRKAGGALIYTEYPGVDHFSWIPAYAEPEIVPWIFCQTKAGGDLPPAPKNLKFSHAGDSGILTWTMPAEAENQIMCFNVYKDSRRLTVTLSDLKGDDASGMAKLHKRMRFADAKFDSLKDKVYSVTAINYRNQESKAALLDLHAPSVLKPRPFIHPDFSAFSGYDYLISGRRIQNHPRAGGSPAAGTRVLIRILPDRRGRLFVEGF